MTTRDLFNSNKLKKQLQASNAEKRSKNLADVQVAAAAHEPGRNDLQPAMPTVMKPIEALHFAPNRTRLTTPRFLESLIRSVRKFGIVMPILIDKTDTIVAGHALWGAARKLNLQTIECRLVEHLEPLEMEALSLALNRIGELGEYDLDKLRDRMIAIESGGIELISTGFTLPEISQIKVKPLPPQEDTPGSGKWDKIPVTSEPGDLFHLNRHRLLCGDALDALSYEKLLECATATAVFSDPPYNCKIEGFVGGLGEVKHEDFLMAAGEQSDAEFADFLATYLRHCRDHCSAGAVRFACMDWRQIDILLGAGREVDLNRINMAVWNKGAGGMGGLYRSAHEFVAIFCTVKSPAVNNVQLGVHGRDRTNVWTYAGANRKGSTAGQALADHPTPKPVELVVDALMDVTNPGDLVLDPFTGSGTTIIACEQSDRRGCGIELDPKYVDRAIMRWEKLTGEEAVHIETGLTFRALAKLRSNDGGEQDDGE